MLNDRTVGRRFNICNILKTDYDLHPNRLIDSFMHRKFSEESNEPSSAMQLQ